MMKSTSTLITLVSLSLCVTAANAQLVTYNTSGNTGLETFEPVFTFDPGVTGSNLALGSGIAPAANTNRLGGNNYFDTGDVSPTDLADAIADSEFFEFTVTPVTGFQYDVTNFSFIFDRSSTGPGTSTLRSSIDGFAADIGSATMPGSTSTFTVIPVGFTGLTTATTFRLYAYGATGTAGSGGFDTTATATAPNVVLNGSAVLIGTIIPEPTTLAALGGAAGLGLIRRRSR